MALIPDVSAIISLAFDDEDGTYARAVVEAIAADQAIVPTLFWFEVRNTLLMGERRKRSTPEQTTTFLADLDMLPFEIDSRPREPAVFSLARRHDLTIYDAAYLELAQRKSLPLATVDRALIRAAAAAGVAVWQDNT
jgi:predicted nucleic acid-binding protein